MAEAEEGGATGGSKKDRSPSFPYITLTRALERTRSIYDAARRHEVRMADIGSPKSSATLQTVAALIAYGLLDESGSGANRKFRVSDLGFRALEDQRPGAKEAALAEAALKPRLIGEYAGLWREGRPSDPICVSELRFERGFTEDGAKAFLRVFDDAARFTGGQESDSVDDKDGQDLGLPASPEAQPIGAAAMPEPAPAVAAAAFPPAMAAVAENDIKVMLDGAHLRVSAFVDLKGAKRLMKALSANMALLEDEDE